MLGKEDLQSIAQLMDVKLKPISDRLYHIQEDIDVLKEDSAVTRNAANDLLEWADDASIQTIPIFNKRKPK